MRDVNVIDESGLNEIMLSVADPDEAVAYFTRAVRDEPGPHRPAARPRQVADPRRPQHRGRRRLGSRRWPIPRPPTTTGWSWPAP